MPAERGTGTGETTSLPVVPANSTLALLALAIYRRRVTSPHPPGSRLLARLPPHARERTLRSCRQPRWAGISQQPSGGGARLTLCTRACSLVLLACLRACILVRPVSISACASHRRTHPHHALATPVISCELTQQPASSHSPGGPQSPAGRAHLIPTFLDSQEKRWSKRASAYSCCSGRPASQSRLLARAIPCACACAIQQTQP